MTKSTITRERLEQLANFKGAPVTRQEEQELARIALAAMDCEPVGEFYEDGPLNWYQISDGDRVPSHRRIPLYRHAQPAPVVPDAATAIRACLSEFPESVRDIVEECADIAENACRAAMLQAEPVTTANKLGNNPVIQDTWIPVRERNPNDIGRYWCYVEDQKSHGEYSYQWSCSWNGSYWSGAMMHGRVTHWMPLPAAPQEVE